jgi:hypothetical protein
MILPPGFSKTVLVDDPDPTRYQIISLLMILVRLRCSSLGFLFTVPIFEILLKYANGF